MCNSVRVCERVHECTRVRGVSVYEWTRVGSNVCVSTCVQECAQETTCVWECGCVWECVYISSGGPFSLRRRAQGRVRGFGRTSESPG